MWEYERCLFVKKLLAVLYTNDYKAIPINNELFKDGVKCAADYFNTQKEQLGENAKILDPLFIQYSTSGEFKDFTKVIDSFNGRVLSFENPYYIKANIRMEEDYLEALLEDEELNLPEAFMDEMANRFAKGAQLVALN